MQIKNNQWYRFFLWTAPPLLLILVYVCLGFYYENNDDIARDYALRAPHNPILVFFVWMPLLSKGLRWFYILAPTFPFYTLLMYILTGGALYLMASFFAKKYTEPYEGYWLLGFSFLLFFVGGILENVMYLTYTRVAILTCGMLILKLFFSENLSRAQVLLIGVFLLVASLLRVSCLFLSLAILAPVLITRAIREGKGLVIHSVVLISVMLIAIGIQSKESLPEQELNKAIQTIYDYKYINTEKITDPRDKLFLEAVYKWFYADPKIINVHILNELLEKYPIGIIKSGFKDDVVYFVGLVLRNYFFLLFINILLLIYFYRTRSKKEFLLMAIYFLFFYVLITFISLALKSEERVIGPSILLFTFALLVIADAGLFVKWVVRRRGIVILLLLILGLTAYKVKGRVDFNLEMRKKNEATLNVLNDFGKGKVIMITSLGSHLSFLDPFKYYPVYMGDTMIRLSGGLSFFSENQKMIKQVAGSDSLLELFEKASARDNYILIATEDDINFIGRYFESFYKKNFGFTPVEEHRFNKERLKAFVVFRKY